MSAPAISDADFFEAKYQQDPDPWNFSTDRYEGSRYKAILAALSHQTYENGFEPGCSIGVLTERLAGICKRVVAIDFSPTAIQQAKIRCAHLPNVDLRCDSLPAGIPGTPCDLVVLSEIGYYFSPDDLMKVASTIIARMPARSTLLASHWLGESADHIMHGDQVHDILRAMGGLRLDHSERHAHFRLDRWSRL